MRVRYGKFYADWRDESGRRHTKALCTIEEALLWKETQRRAPRIYRSRFASKEEQEANERKLKRESAQRCWLKNPMRFLFRKLGYEAEFTRNGLTIVSSRNLRAPTWVIIDRNGKRTVETLEPPQHMAKRLGLA